MLCFVFFNNLLKICNIFAGTSSLSSSPWYLSPPPPLCWCLCCHVEGKIRDLICLTTYFQRKKKWIVIPATCFDLLCSALDGTIGTRVTERKWLRGRNDGGGKGNASYSRERDLDCVKINLHEIGWHNWYLFEEKMIFKAEETSGPSMWATVVQLLIPVSPGWPWKEEDFQLTQMHFRGRTENPSRIPLDQV